MNKIKKTTKEWTAKDEGTFVKRYNDVIKRIHRLSKSDIIVLDYLAMKMRNDNIIYLPLHAKNAISKESGLKKNTIEHALTSLVKGRIVERVGHGVYRVSAKYYAKVQWKRVLAMRYSEVKKIDEVNFKVEIYESVDDAIYSTEEINKILKEDTQEDEKKTT